MPSTSENLELFFVLNFLGILKFVFKVFILIGFMLEKLWFIWPEEITEFVEAKEFLEILLLINPPERLCLLLIKFRMLLGDSLASVTREKQLF